MSEKKDICVICDKAGNLINIPCGCRSHTNCIMLYSKVSDKDIICCGCGEIIYFNKKMEILCEKKRAIAEALSLKEQHLGTKNIKVHKGYYYILNCGHESFDTVCIMCVKEAPLPINSINYYVDDHVIHLLTIIDGIVYAIHVRGKVNTESFYAKIVEKKEQALNKEDIQRITKFLSFIKNE